MAERAIVSPLASRPLLLNTVAHLMLQVQLHLTGIMVIHFGKIRRIKVLVHIHQVHQTLYQ